MMFSKEIYIHDAELEIVVPNGIIDFNEENIDDIIDAKQRTQIFYDELLHVYLISTLPPESNFENKAEATEFFKKLEVKLQATLIDTPNLSVPSNYHSSELIRRTSSSSSTASSISGIFSGGTSMKSSLSSTSTSPSTPGSPDSGYSVKRLSSSRLIEGTVIYSAQYDSKNNNNMVIVKRNDCWICVLPLLFPVAHIKSRAQNQIALNVTVTQSRRKVNSPDSYLYSMDNFGMNLLEGLNDDPAFESVNFSIPTSHPDSTKRASIYSDLPSTPIKRCTRKILSVKSTLNARIRTTYVSPSENTLMMSVELENDTENDIIFSIEDVKLEIAHGFVTRYAWGPQDTSNDKVPITLRPLDQVNFLYNVTILEDPSFPEPLNTQQYYPTPIPNSKTSSRRESMASINSALSTPSVENNHRTLSVIVKGRPIIDGVKSHCIESKWNCMLNVSTLLKDDLMASMLQLERVESNKYAPMIGNNKFNYNVGINTTTAVRDSFSLKNTKNYDSIEYGNNVGLEININGVNSANKKQHNGYIPDMNPLYSNGENNGILPNGRLPKSQKQLNSDLDARDGVSVSFSVSGKPTVGKVFTMKVFIANKSKHVRRFTLSIPNKKRPNEKHSRLLPKTFLSQSTDITLVESDNIKNGVLPLEVPFMDETVFLRKHLEYETPDADLICLDNDIRIGPINPYDSESATLHFISTKKALQTVELIQLVDDDTGFITNLREVIQVNVAKNEKRMKRINHNYNNSVLRHIEVTG